MIKDEIEDMVSVLKNEGKVHLAKAIGENWDKTLLEYSKELNSYRPTLPMETVLKEAISQELTRLDWSKDKITEIINNLEKRRILNTYPHITCAGKQRHLFIDWLASLSLSDDDFYSVAMFSGVPFSNKTRPGRICKKDEEINLMPSNMQDELVYRNKIPAKMKEVSDSLPEKIRNLFPKTEIGHSYTKWALQSSLNLEKSLLRGKPVFFDFNEVASNYFLLAIQDLTHPISKMLFSQKERSLLIKHMSEVVFFYGSIQKDNHKEMENYYLRDGYIESESGKKIELTKEAIQKELETGLCPGMVIGFFIFAFMNQFQCFGSFAQIEYLPFYHDKFMQFEFLKEYKIDQSPAGALTTGGFKDNMDLNVFDLALLDTKVAKDILKKYEGTTFGEAILAIKDVLLHQNYSMNLVRK